MKRIGLTVLLLVAFLGFDIRSGSQYAAQPRSQQPEFVADEVIVKFRQGIDEFNKDLARFRVSGTRKKIFRYVPGLEVVKLRRGVSVEEAIKLYQQDPNVSYAEPNYILRTQLTPNDPRFTSGEMWGLNNTGQSGGTADADIDAVEAWNQTTGNSNIIVAIIDSGVDYNHPDLAANMFRTKGIATAMALTMTAMVTSTIATASTRTITIRIPWMITITEPMSPEPSARRAITAPAWWASTGTSK